MATEMALLYVSRSLLLHPEMGGEIDDIVAVARSRNLTLNVTGALISTRSSFAQILEGTRRAVDELMNSICKDWRHTDLDVLFYKEQQRRLFSDWSMAYAGPSSYVAQHVDPLLENASPAERDTQIRQLVRLLREFVQA